MATIEKHAGFTSQIDYGVLVIRFTTDRLVDEHGINGLHKHILTQLPLVRRGVVLDCARLTGPVTSFFLGMLLRLVGECLAGDIRFLVANLAEDQLAVIRRSQLHRRIPVRGRSKGNMAWELDRFDEWSKLHGKSRQDEPSGTARASNEWFRKNKTEAMLATVAALAAILVSGWYVYSEFIASSGRTGPRGIPFSANLAGTVQHQAGQNELRFDENALVVAWPTSYRPKTKLTLNELISRTPTAEEPWPHVASVHKSGSFHVRLAGRGSSMDFYVLIISRQVGRSGNVPEHQKDVLSRIFSNVDTVVRDRAYTLNMVFTEPDSNATSCAVFK